MIFMAFFKNMDSQNTVPSTGFQSLFIHIFSISVTVSLKDISPQPSKRYGGGFNTGEMNQSKNPFKPHLFHQ